MALEYTDLNAQTSAYLDRVYYKSHQAFAVLLLGLLGLAAVANSLGFFSQSILEPLILSLAPSVVCAVIIGILFPTSPLSRHVSAAVLAYFACAMGLASASGAGQSGYLELRHVVLLSLLVFRDSSLLLTALAVFAAVGYAPGLVASYSSTGTILPWSPYTQFSLLGVLALGVLSNRNSKQEIVATAESQLVRIRRMQSEVQLQTIEQELERTQLELVLQGVERAGAETREVVTRLFSLLREQERRVSEQDISSTRLSATGQQARENVRHFQAVLDRLHELTSLVQSKGRQGGVQLTELQKLFGFIVRESGQISEDFRGCSTQADEISKIVQGIESVTRQTRLLSLNAAVEAEKAGEFGRGFGVLAQEIRRLASQTEQFLSDIEFLLREIQGAVSLGAAGVEQFMEEVRRSSASTDGIIEQIDRVLGEGKAVESVFVDMEQSLTGQLRSVLDIARLTEEADGINRFLGQKTKEFARAVSELEISIYKVSALASKSSRGEHEVRL